MEPIHPAETRAEELIQTLAAGHELSLSTSALFREVVEPLCDSFEPSFTGLCARLFSQLLARTGPWTADDLLARYRRVRVAQPYAGPEPEQVVVLSRVTLGADVVVTSVILDAVLRRFPDAKLLLAGSRKSWELFASNPRIGLLEIPYSRAGSLEDRLAASWALAGRIPAGALVIDPDSRLTQLGLVPICAENRYLFFESRSYGADSSLPLGELARQWISGALQAPDARAFVAPVPHGPSGLVTVSLGTGDNPDKGLDSTFERALLSGLADRGLDVMIDYGFGEDEARRVDAAIDGLPVKTWKGAFAPFASMITRSRLYIGYDSAGQHVAAVSGVPLVTVFRGYATERTYQRWMPHGPGPKITLRSGEGIFEAVDSLLKAS